MSINKSIEVLYCPCCNKRSHLCIFNVQRTALETENAKLKQENEAKEKRWQELLEYVEKMPKSDLPDYDMAFDEVYEKMQELEGNENE